jgi:hypothetical protein
LLPGCGGFWDSGKGAVVVSLELDDSPPVLISFLGDWQALAIKSKLAIAAVVSNKSLHLGPRGRLNKGEVKNRPNNVLARIGKIGLDVNIINILYLAHGNGGHLAEAHRPGMRTGVRIPPALRLNQCH